MPKQQKKKKSKVIKQKQKQQISIVINSNNRSKRTTVPRPPPPPPPQAPRNNPPVVNIMGDSRPQVSPSGNFSGIGQQNRIFANDSALEQRLARLLKFENDQSANATPALSNAKVLAPSRARATSPYSVKFQAPPSNPVLNSDFFNTRRKDYEDALTQSGNDGRSPLQALREQGDDEEKQQDRDDIDETKSNLSFMERGIQKAKNFFTPKPNIQTQVRPEINTLENVYIKQEPKTPMSSDLTVRDQEMFNDDEEEDALITAEIDKPWKKMKRIEKREWALANRGGGNEDVRYSEDEIDKMLVPQLNEIYADVLLARQNTLANAKRI